MQNFIHLHNYSYILQDWDFLLTFNILSNVEILTMIIYMISFINKFGHT